MGITDDVSLTWASLIGGVRNMGDRWAALTLVTDGGIINRDITDWEATMRESLDRGIEAIGAADSHPSSTGITTSGVRDAVSLVVDLWVVLSPMGESLIGSYYQGHHSHGSC